VPRSSYLAPVLLLAAPVILNVVPRLILNVRSRRARKLVVHHFG
jgi:hypothetical protein